MISMPIFAEDTQQAATSLERLQHKQGARRLERAAAQVRAAWSIGILSGFVLGPGVAALA